MPCLMTQIANASSTLALTSALDGDGWLTPRPGRFTPENDKVLGGFQGQSRRVRKISPLPEFEPRTVQHVASRHTDYAIQAP